MPYKQKAAVNADERFFKLLEISKLKISRFKSFLRTIRTEIKATKGGKEGAFSAPSNKRFRALNGSRHARTPFQQLEAQRAQLRSRIIIAKKPNPAEFLVRTSMAKKIQS